MLSKRHCPTAHPKHIVSCQHCPVWMSKKRHDIPGLLIFSFSLFLSLSLSDADEAVEGEFPIMNCSHKEEEGKTEGV